MNAGEIATQNILIIGRLIASVNEISEIISQQNIHIIKAASDKKAIEALSGNAVSLIIIDASTSETDSRKWLDHPIFNSGLPQVPVIFVVAANQPETGLPDDNHHTESHTFDVLCKPLQARILNVRIKLLLQLTQQEHLITQQQQELQESFTRLKHYAQHDQLTGLLNRDQLSNILVRMMANSRRSKRLLGLILLDLDHFKSINDTLGHEVGDLLLKSVAERICHSVREDDFIARLGGDEFAIITSNLETEECAGVVAQRILDKLVEPHQLGHHEVLISSSIGIALYDNQNKTASDLMKSADSAMYLAKTKGRSQYAYFSPDQELKALRRMEIARDLNHAIDNNELSVFFQPQISAANGKAVGFEALMRWQKNQEWISPDQFIPVAEETGLIPKLGEWILSESCKQLKHWQEQKLLGLNVKVAVNISSRQIQSRQFINVLKTALKQSGLSPACLELELTESTVMDDPETCISVFHEIHQLGIEIAVDDFGTGYSSLAYLRRLPLDRLKIDRSFVRDIDIDRNDEAIVKAIIGLSHNLGLSVVAEGVETEEQSNFLRQNHCDTLQGYLFARPMKADDIPEFLIKNAS